MKAVVKNFVIVFTLVLSLGSFASCSNDSEYSLGKFVLGIATVVNEPGTNWYLKLDSGEKLWIASGNNFYSYKPIDGQRVLIDYTPLSGPIDGFDHMIKINQIINIATRPTEMIFDEAKLLEKGEDRCPIVASGFPSGIWVSGDNEYLNVVVAIYSSKYQVSLIDNTLAEYPDDGYKYLELHYNAYDSMLDFSLAKTYSFVLRGLDLEGKKGLRIKRINAKGEEEIMSYEFDDMKKYAIGSEGSELNNEGELVEGEIK